MNEQTLRAMREMVKIQGSDGNWNYDEYMRGMYNGMELMLSVIENREPVYKEAPGTEINYKLCPGRPDITIQAGTVKFSSNKPLTPDIFAQPLFTQIYLSWTNDPDADHYEVYGSREPGFAATYSTLLLKSKTHEFVHEVDVNERWFYRVRAIGKNGKVSNFTEEVSAKTVKPWYSGVVAKTLPEVVASVFSECEK
ncbi:hypothetical protein [Bacillus licheniformis]|uniref:hypothetical protein n=1 Tax=Bacillus licheniformis TaxID=1402 RepID=UPI002DB9A737|nr:hypothetical protein [Bacillus licheniformis]MEC1351682.1 hypothetical protein [Bacillus licheniformis]